MPKHCKLKEPKVGFFSTYPFGVNDKGVPVFECIRILFGTIDVENKHTYKTTKLRHCFINQTNNNIGKHSLAFIIERLFDGDLNFDDVKTFLSKGANDNKEFWEEIKSELCLCLVARRNGKYVESFLYLYRLIELISVALPLVYASSQPDYKKALEFIKSLSVSSRDGDLSILKIFVKKAEKSGGYDGIQIDFPFLNEDTTWRTEFKKQAEAMAASEKGLTIKFNDDNSEFSVQFSEMPLFFVSCRNRLFHNSQTGHNFKLDELNGAENLCQMLIDPTVYWFKLILIEVVKVHAKRYI